MMRDAGGDSGSAVTSITTPAPRRHNYGRDRRRARARRRTCVPASSSPISREQPAALATGMAASRRSTLAPLNHVLRDPAGAVCSGSPHHSTADRLCIESALVRAGGEYEGLMLRENLGLGAGFVEVVGGGGIFCRQPACFCKSEATDRAPAGSTLAGRGKPNRSRRVIVS